MRSAARRRPGKVFRCRDIGIDCDHVIRGMSESEVLDATLAHAQDVHGVLDVPHDLVGRVRSKIGEE
jgi:predicted small metal-binding protein